MHQPQRCNSTSKPGSPDYRVYLLELFCLFAVGLMLAVTVANSDRLATLNYGGAYLFAVLTGLSSLVLSVALITEHMKEYSSRDRRASL